MKSMEIAFAQKVKNEIALATYSLDQKKFILSGFARNGGTFSIGSRPSLELHTEIACVAKLLYSCLKEVYHLTPTIRYERVTRFHRSLVYIVTCVDPKLYAVMEDLEILQGGLDRIKPKQGLLRKNLRYLVIGSFLATGSVNNPSSNKTAYFLEMAFTDKADALAIRRKINSFREEKTMTMKYIKRRERHVLYLKKSDQISVFLSYIGATESMFDFENARILKEDINISNRLSICDSANLGKTLSTATKDIALIQKLLAVKPLTSYDAKTAAVISARLKYPEDNYRELAEVITQSGFPISKSGVVHVLTALRSEAVSLALV